MIVKIKIYNYMVYKLKIRMRTIELEIIINSTFNFNNFKTVNNQ